MLHNSGDYDVITIANRINLSLNTLEILIYQNRVILCNSVDDVYELSRNNGESDIYVVEYSGKKNILVAEGKLLFNEDPQSTKDWADDIEEHPGYNDGHMNLIERLDKYAIFDNVHLKIINDMWYDEVKFFDLEMFDDEGVAAVVLDEKCNIMFTDEDSQRFKQFMFKEPVDDVKTYEKFLVITKGDQDFVAQSFVLFVIKSIWIRIAILFQYFLHP